jgi:predicted RNase H-like nuclease
MSMEAYGQDRADRGSDESEVYLKLKEAEIEAESTTKRYSLEEVMDSMEKIITEAEGALAARACDGATEIPLTGQIPR